MDIVFLGGECRRTSNFCNVFIIEEKEVLEISQIESQRVFIFDFFSGMRDVLHCVVSLREEEDRIVIHLRISHKLIKDIIEKMSEKFKINQWNMNISRCCIHNEPYRRFRADDKHQAAYIAALDRILATIDQSRR